MDNNRIIVDRNHLETRFEEISELCHKAKQPIFIKNKNEIDLVLMSIDYYKENNFYKVWPIPDFK